MERDTAKLQGETRPQWLIHLLEVNFYEKDDTCSITGHHWKPFFCKTCMDGPLCDKCWINSHRDHDVLRVCRASFQVAVAKDAITKYKDVDVDGIQPFSVNSKSIFFLHKKLKKSVQNCPKCQVCEGHIIDSAYKFCSISCKVESFQETFCYDEFYQPRVESFQETFCYDEFYQPSNSILSADDVQEVQLPRRHRRKGIPHRSPLF